VNALLPRVGSEDNAAPAADSFGPQAARGVVALLTRRGLTTVIGVGGSIVLARSLQPRDFGAFAVVTMIFGILNSLGDGGLAATLVRQRTEPTRRELDVVFTAQQLMSAVLCLVLGVAVIALHGRIEGSYTFLLLCVIAAIALTSPQIVAVAQLERRLSFPTLGFIGVCESAVFYGVAIALADLGVGVRSFGIALVAQAAVGTAMYVGASRYRPSFAWTRADLRDRYAFGIPFQGVELVSLTKDAFTPVLVGLVLGARDVGFITWANQVCAYALIALMALSKLYLPIFSRLRDDPLRLAAAVEKTVLLANAITVPVSLFILVCAQPLVHVVYGSKWHPAIPLLYIMWSANLLVPTAAPLLSLVTTMGQPGFALKMAIIWMLGTWLIGAPLILTTGMKGFAIANLCVQASNFILFNRAKQLLPNLRIARVAAAPWITAACVAPLLIAVVVIAKPHNVLEIASVGIGWVGCYAAVCAWVFRARRTEFIAMMKRAGQWA
jgi:lipopolysaccharide exporter